MIAAFARAGAVFGDERFLGVATSAADFILRHLRSPDGRLFRSGNADGSAKLSGYLEDYTLFADALVTLFEAKFDSKYLRAAAELADMVLKHFADPNGPGFFFTADDHEELIARTKDLHDGSTPSGNAVAVTVLLRLAKLLDRREFAAKAEETLRSYREMMAEHPAASGQMLMALDFYLGPTREIAVVGTADSPETHRASRQSVGRSGRTRCSPSTTPRAARPPDSIPLLKDKPAMNGAVTVYVCENFACQAPLVGVEAVERFFGERGAS